MKYKIGDVFESIDESLDATLQIVGIYNDIGEPYYTVNAKNMGYMEKSEADLDARFKLVKLAEPKSLTTIILELENRIEILEKQMLSIGLVFKQLKNE
jgi:hypothetical protein